MSSTTCPVLYPTLEEFKNFQKYIQFLESSLDLEQIGLVKIVPPKGWYDKTVKLSEIKDMMIQRPVAQLVSRVGSGSFTVHLLEKPNITVEQFSIFAQANSRPKQDASNEEIERMFWRSVGLNGGLDDPMYGADMVGSFFGSDLASSWNVNHLDSSIKLIGHNLPGVSNAMLYFGSWRAMFSFHTEDMELYSINYLHYGASKAWYSVPPRYKKRFELMAESYYPEEAQQCPEFLRHKTSLISPTRLKDAAIPYHTAIQNQGEFMITFPGSYHQGFNHGFNIAEATNFATERWIELGREAKVCQCTPDSVKIDMEIFETLYYRDKMKKKADAIAKQNSCDSVIDLTEDTPPDDCFNTNNDENTKWLLRCKCGKRNWYPLIPIPSHSDHQIKEEIQSLNYATLLVAEGDIFQCTDCGLWCHIECLYGKKYNDSNLPEDAKCHVCSTLSITPVTTDETHTRGEYQISIPIGNESSQSDERGEENDQEVVQRTIPRSQWKRFHPHLHDIITAAVYSKALLRYQNVTGEIVAIEGSNIRLHVKGTKKADDHWINLDEYNYTTDIILHSSVSQSSDDNEKAQAKKSTKRKQRSSKKSSDLGDNSGDELNYDYDQYNQKFTSFLLNSKRRVVSTEDPSPPQSCPIPSTSTISSGTTFGDSHRATGFEHDEAVQFTDPPDVIAQVESSESESEIEPKEIATASESDSS